MGTNFFIYFAILLSAALTIPPALAETAAEVEKAWSTAKYQFQTEVRKLGSKATPAEIQKLREKIIVPAKTHLNIFYKEQTNQPKTLSKAPPAVLVGGSKPRDKSSAPKKGRSKPAPVNKYKGPSETTF